MSGDPYAYENYPWVPMGNGWLLNFPWMNNGQHPSDLHLWNGQGYRIPAAFWTGAASRFENHQGENFLLLRYQNGTIALFAKSGVVYRFDPGNSLKSIVDAIGNTITFSYDGSNRIYKITDTVGRIFQLCYSNSMLSSIVQTTGDCTNGIVKRISYSYTGQTLTKVIDPMGRITSFEYQTVVSTNPNPWLISKIVYPTGWYTSFSYAQVPLGSEAYTYRVNRQTDNPGSEPTARQVEYSYTPGPGQQVTGSTVKTYNGTSTLPSVSTEFSFSYAGMTESIYDSSHNLVRGLQQSFGVHGELVKETMIVTDPQSPPRVDSYTNYYQYDLWGNLIYSRKVIDPSANWYHESFNAYYNNGLPVGFYAFGETFSEGNFTFPDHSWSSTTSRGIWQVKNGQYNGTNNNSGNGLSNGDNYSWADIGKQDGSIQASVYLAKPILSSDNKAGVLAHLVSASKWILALHNTTSGQVLELLDDVAGSWASWATTPCSIVLGVWYNFTMTVRGFNVIGSAVAPSRGVSCSVQASFPTWSLAATGTGFGLYAGGYSALFDNVTVATVSPYITTTGFSNSFFSSGAPGLNIHGAVAGTAELQNGAGTVPLETYYAYDFSGRLSQEKHRYDSPSLQWLSSSRTYDSYGNPKTFTDAMNNVTYYAYSASYQYAYLTNVTRRDGSTQITTLYSYNGNTGTMLSVKDPLLYNTTYQYDILNRVTRVNYPNGVDYTSYSYSDSGNYVNTTNENSWKTRQFYDGLGRLSSVERFLNGVSYSTETSAYNWQNKVTIETDPMTRKTLYQYDVLGRTINVTKADGSFTQEYYNDTAPWVRFTDESGNYRCNYYDRLGRLISVVERATVNCGPGLVTNYYYDEVGNLGKTTNSVLRSTTYSYDNLNRLTGVTYPDWTSESYSYNNNGNLVAKTDRTSTVRTLYGYDPLNRLKTITYCGGNAVTSDSYTYDKNSNVVRLDSQNATLTYGYDARNRILSEGYSVNPGSTVVDLGCFTGGGGGGGGGSVAYGTLITLGDMTSVPVQNLRVGTSLLSYNTTTSQYTVSSITSVQVVLTTNMLVIRTQDPFPLRVDNATAQKLWVKKSDGTIGWLSVTQLRPGDYLFNALDQRWTQVTSIETSPKGVHIMYDLYTSTPFNYIADGYLDPMKTGPVSRGSLTTLTGGTPLTYSINYKYSGELVASIAYPDGLVVKYSYDGLGRVLTVSNSTSYANSFTYYKDDQINSFKYGNGLVANYTYDVLGRPSTIKVAGKILLESLSYGYNKVGAVASVIGLVNSVTQNVNEQYTYDALRRLTNSTLTTCCTTTYLWYEYDNVGNRQRQGLKQGTGAWTVTSYYDNLDNNEMTGSSDGVSRSYDPNGNLVLQNTGSASWSYSWDVPGHLLKTTTGTSQNAYAYDGKGRRVESVEGSSNIYYAFMGTETLYEKVQGRQASTDYVYAGGLRIANVTGLTTVSYYHTDALGSTRLVTDSSKNVNVLFSDSYQPFGQDNAATGSETHKFTGKPVSQTTGLYYYYQRWYDSSTGRFISQDPIAGFDADPESLNPYIYVSDSPTVLSDPAGLTAYVAHTGSGLSCPSFWSDPAGSFSCQLSHTPTPMADVVEAYDLAIWGIEECEEECGQVISDAGSLLRPGAEEGSAATRSVTSDITFTTDTTRITTTDLTDLLAGGGGNALTEGVTNDLVDTSIFWKTTESGGYDLQTTQIHHLLPRQFQGFFQSEGVGLNIEDYTVQLDRGVHMVLHGRGGSYFASWNGLWKGFIINNPGADASDVLEFLRITLDYFGF